MSAAPQACVNIALGERSYSIHIGPGLLVQAGQLLKDLPARDLLIVTNTTVAPLYQRSLESALQESGRRVHSLALPDGEQYKSLETTSSIFDALVAARMNRDAAVIALGGGVVGDIAGFAAACYQRGIDFVQVPTTLLAQVDSSVGGKTAVNHPQGKNLIGAFHQPRCVITDTNTLSSLPTREYRAGLAEVVKYGLVFDHMFFEWLQQHAGALQRREPASLIQAIKRSCEIKAAVVSQDEREQGLRAILNLGHTFGHAIEAAAGYGQWLHGEAVAIGMSMSADMSHAMGQINAADLQRTLELLRELGLPLEAPRIGAARALMLMGMDKKVLQGKLRLVLLRRVGEAVITSDYPHAVLEATLARHFG